MTRRVRQSLRAQTRDQTTFFMTQPKCCQLYSDFARSNNHNHHHHHTTDTTPKTPLTHMDTTHTHTSTYNGHRERERERKRPRQSWSTSSIQPEFLKYTYIYIYISVIRYNRNPENIMVIILSAMVGEEFADGYAPNPDDMLIHPFASVLADGVFLVLVFHARGWRRGRERCFAQSNVAGSISRSRFAGDTTLRLRRQRVVGQRMGEVVESFERRAVSSPSRNSTAEAWVGVVLDGQRQHTRISSRRLWKGWWNALGLGASPPCQRTTSGGCDWSRHVLRSAAARDVVRFKLLRVSINWYRQRTHKLQMMKLAF